MTTSHQHRPRKVANDTPRRRVQLRDGRQVHLLTAVPPTAAARNASCSARVLSSGEQPQSGSRSTGIRSSCVALRRRWRAPAAHHEVAARHRGCRSQRCTTCSVAHTRPPATIGSPPNLGQLKRSMADPARLSLWSTHGIRGPARLGQVRCLSLPGRVARSRARRVAWRAHGHCTRGHCQNSPL